MAEIDFGGVVETVVTREEFPLEKAREVLKDEVVAVLGYGVQGPAQAMNMRDNGIKVIGVESIQNQATINICAVDIIVGNTWKPEICAQYGTARS